MKPSPQAVEILAQAVQDQAPANRNAADSLRAGSWGNMWTAAALVAIDRALDLNPDDIE